MSVKLMGLVWGVDLPAKEKLLLMALADNADEFGGQCFPSVATLSQKTSMPERTVQRTLGKLIEANVVSTYYAARNGKQIRFFRIAIEGIEERPRPQYDECPKQLRLDAIEVFNRVCVYCKQPGDEKLGPDGKAWHIDRIVPGSRGGKYTADNIALACGTCNRSKKAKDAPRGTPSMGAILARVDRGAISDQEGCQSGTERGATDGTQSVMGTVSEPPIELNREAWRMWVEYRKSKRLTYTPIGALQQMRWLAKFTPDDQAQIVGESVRQGYQGLFELKGAGNGASKQVGKPRLSAVERVRQANERWLSSGDEAGGTGVVIDG